MFFSYTSSRIPSGSNPQAKKDKETQENIQRGAKKLVHEIKHLTYSERLTKLSLITLKIRRDRGDLVGSFKNTNNLSKLD